MERFERKMRVHVVFLITVGLVLMSGQQARALEAAFVGQWGGFGSLNGQFNDPNALCVDDLDNVYVADTRNNRIQKFDKFGSFIAAWGVAGVGPGQFASPLDIAFDRITRQLFVVDTGNSRIQVFDLDGTLLRHWGTSGRGNGQFFGPVGVAAGPDGAIYVVEASNDRVQKFNANGQFITKWGSAGSGFGEFISPVAVAVDSSNRVFVADRSNHRVQIFDSIGNYLSTLNASIGEPRGLSFDRRGHLFVASAAQRAIFEFDAFGSPLFKYGSSGSGNGQFFLLWDVAVNGEGQVLAAGDYRVQAFGPLCRRFFAEGATGFFGTRIAILNPSASVAEVELRFLQVGGGVTVRSQFIGARRRATVDVSSIPGLASAEFSVVADANQNVVFDRTMTWDASSYGSHAETNVTEPSPLWYLAEGATHSGFDLFYLLQNPNAQQVTATVRFLRPGGVAPIVLSYPLPANSRTNVWVNIADPELANTDVSGVVSATLPVIVERAMYLSGGGQMFRAGHESAGVTTATGRWFLAEGATGTFFDLFVLVANATASDAQIRATFLLPQGETIVRNYTVLSNSRFNIWVDEEGPELADTAVSTTIESTNGVPIVVERAMWWPGSASTWQEAHNSPGSTETGLRWALAEGEQGGPRNLETYILIANTSNAPGQVRVTLLFEDGTHAETVVSLSPNSRTNVSGATFPNTIGRRFGAIIESVGASPPQIVVERAMYSDALGVHWAAGTNALATRIR